MAGQAPATPPPMFGTQYADRQAQQQRLEQLMVGSDLDRRSGLMQNIISNAPNIAALSGVGAVDQLGNMFADAETPIFNNQYGQEGDMIRRQQQMAQLASTQRSNRPKAGGGGGGKGGNPAVDPNRMGFRIPEGYPGAGQIVPFDNPEDVQKWATIYGVDPVALSGQIVPPGFAGTHSIGTTGAGSGNTPGAEVNVGGPQQGDTFTSKDGVKYVHDGVQWVPG